MKFPVRIKKAKGLTEPLSNKFDLFQQELSKAEIQTT